MRWTLDRIEEAGGGAVGDLHHSVYVIELDEAVREDHKFATANQGCRPDKPCLYVGLTGLTPEQRFEQHMQGIKASRIVKHFGKCLRPDRYERFNPMSYEDAAAMEVELARRLRQRGFGVWQH